MADLDTPPDGFLNDAPPDGFVGKTDPKKSGMQILSDAVSSSTQDILRKPINAFRQYMTDPTAQAKTLPVLGGIAGSVLGPGGATAGAMLGQTGRDLALTALSDPNAPQTTGEALKNLAVTGGEAAAGEGTAQVLGKALSWFKDLTSAGANIGKTEQAAGIVTRAPNKFPTSGNVGEWLNNLEDQFAAGAINTPQTARDAKTITDFIYNNPSIIGKSKEVTVQAARVGKLAQQTLNDLVPGRADAAADFAQMKDITNAAKTGGKVAGGLGAVISAYAALKRFGLAP